MATKLSSLFILAASAVLLYGLYLMFGPMSTDKMFLTTLMTGFFLASVGILFDTYSWSEYSRERRRQKRAQLGFNYFSVVTTAATLVYLVFFF
jgi:hypothetical protein